MMGCLGAKNLLRSKKKCFNAIILGTEYPEYKLFKVLKRKGDKVHFFISEDPWKYNTLIDGVICRYPVEIKSLCENYQIDYVYYCDPLWLDKIPNLPSSTRLMPYTD